jgi:beta-lactamase regulating signal transducer with metallopeptidase domain
MALPSLHFFTAAIEHLEPGAILTVCGGTLILVLAGVTTLTMRRASASARHQVWLLGFLGALALPVLSATLPAWHVLPWPQAKAQWAIITLPESTFPPPSLEPEKIPDTATNKESITGQVASPANAASPTIAKIAPVSQTPITPAPAPSRFRFSRMREMRWTHVVTACWLLGSAMVLFRVLLGHLSLLALQRRCTSVTRGELFDSLECLRMEIGVRRRVALISCAARSMPMTWGIWRPRLLIPDDAATWSPAHHRDVLLHELGHVSRWDCLTQLLSQVACAFYWFNPFIWIASRRMQVERERACDDPLFQLLKSRARPSQWRAPQHWKNA